MGVTRRSVLGGALAGIGDALLAYGENRVRRRQLQEDRAQQQAWEFDKMRLNAINGLTEGIAKDPTQAAMLLSAASANPLMQGLNLGRLRPPDPVVVAALKAKVRGVDNPADLPNPEDVAGLAGLDTTPVAPADPAQAAGAQFGFLSPSSTFEGVNPTVQPVAQAVIDRRQALQQGVQDKIKVAGQTKQAESYGTTTGTNQANNENAPTERANKVADAQALGPVQAANAGLMAGAQADAENTPERQRAKARGAGMVAGAEAGAREAARVQAEKAIRASGLSPQQQQAALQLSDNFRQEATTFKVKEENFRTILGVAKNPSAAGDLSMIFAYMRMLDPGSTVREGEFANAQNARGVPEWMRQQYNRIVNGERLTPVMRTDFLNKSFENYQAAKDGQARVIRDYTDRSLKFGIDPSLVIRSMDPALDTPPGGRTPPPDTPAPSRGGRVRYDENGNPIRE